MSHQPGLEGELAQLREELELSRRELAAARLRIESALEEAAEQRSLREVAEGRLVAVPATTDTTDRPAALGRLAGRLRRHAT